MDSVGSSHAFGGLNMLFTRLRFTHTTHTHTHTRVALVVRYYPLSPLIVPTFITFPDYVRAFVRCRLVLRPFSQTDRHPQFPFIPFWVFDCDENGDGRPVRWARRVVCCFVDVIKPIRHTVGYAWMGHGLRFRGYIYYIHTRVTPTRVRVVIQPHTTPALHSLFPHHGYGFS
jgi:hypothetical protein